MEQKNLPADPSAKTLGIISLILALTSCCCGFLVPLAIILSIIGLISANRSLKEYQLNAENYFPESRTNVYTGKVLNIIALIISSLFSIVLVLYFIIYGTFIFSEFLDEIKNDSIQQYHYENDYDYDNSEEQEIESDYEEEQDDLLYQYGA